MVITNDICLPLLDLAPDTYTKLSHKEYIDPFAVPYTGTNAATKTHSRKFTAKAPRDVHGQLSQNDDENAAAAARSRSPVARV